MTTRTTTSGLVVTRSFDEIPNANDPLTVPPATVGPPSAVPGIVGAVTLAEEGTGELWRTGPPRATAWSGWPNEWDTPSWWGPLQRLTDTAWLCIDLNASILATMPPYLVNASPSLPSDWITNPSPDLYTSWAEFAKQLWWDYQMGEAFILATAYYSSGYPARFHVVPPWTVSAEIGRDGRRRYAIGAVDVTADILHVRYQSTVGDAHGHGPLEAGAGRLVAASALSRYASQLAATGAIPNAVLKTPGALTAEQAATLQERWVTARANALGLPAVLSGGLDFEVLQLSPRDMALLELSQWNESRIAVLLGVPPFLAGLPSGGDSMTYSNVTALFDFHWRAGLKPKASAVMATLSAWLTPRGTTVEVNRDEYVRPGPLERAQTWQILVGLGVLNAEQVAEIERYIVAAPSQTLSVGVFA